MVDQQYYFHKTLLFLDARTGLVEGCSPLTKADKYSILGCNQRFEILDSPALLWVPKVLHETEYDSQLNLYYAVVFLKMTDKESNHSFHFFQF